MLHSYYDFAGGVYVDYCSQTNLGAFRRFESYTSADSSLQFQVMPMLMRDFAIDPAQDLMAIVEGYRSPLADAVMLDATGPDHTLKVHLRTLSSNGLKAHPRARVDTLVIITDPLPDRFSLVKTSIAEDVLGIFFCQRSSMLYIFDWMTGEMLVNKADELLTESLPDFAFLSPRAYSLTDQCGHICLYRLRTDIKRKPATDHDDLPVLLELPKMMPLCETAYAIYYANSFARAPPESTPFELSHDSGVHVVALQVDRQDGSTVGVAFVVKTDTLLGYLRSKPNLSGKSIPWATWGPANSRVFNLGEEGYVNERAISGARVFMPTCRERGGSRSQQRIFDFNVPRGGLGATTPERYITNDDGGLPANLIQSSELVLTASSVLPSDWNVFAEPVTSCLPYHALTLKDGAYDPEYPVLMDDGRLIMHREDEDELDNGYMDIFVF